MQITFPHQAYIPEKSISNVDLTDTEQNSLDEAFGRMHDKVSLLHCHCDHVPLSQVHSLADSNDLVYGSSCPNSLQHQVRAHNALLVTPRHQMLRNAPQTTRDPTSHNRAYLTLAKVMANV